MICVPIVAKNTDEALLSIMKANTLADVLEFRLDLMDSFDLQRMIEASSSPLVVTYRSKKEGGKGSADYGSRVHILLEAFERGAHYIDVEQSLPLEFREKIFRKTDLARIILSAHIFTGTPSTEDLENRLQKMAATGAGIVKIVTRARAVDDNLRVLGLIPLAKRYGVEIVSFCMGPLGRISRLTSHALGGFMTFASLEAGRESADGQIPIEEMRRIMEFLWE